MRLLFLGTGTSAGVPAIGCDCSVCTSPDPRDRRLRTSAAVVFTDPLGRERTILIDASPDLRQQALRAGLKRCDAVLFTHNHVDHTFGLDEVRRFNVVQKGPVDVYAEPHTMEHLRRVYQHVFDRHNNVNDSFVATLIPHLIEPDTPIELFGLRITPIRLLHGRLPILGFRFDRAAPAASTPPGNPAPDHADVLPFAWCTDVSAIPPESWRHLRGLSTLVLDALRRRHHPTHFTLDQALRVAEQCTPRTTYFIHIAHDLAHAEVDAELPENIHLAYDGLELAAPVSRG